MAAMTKRIEVRVPGTPPYAVSIRWLPATVQILFLLLLALNATQASEPKPTLMLTKGASWSAFPPGGDALPWAEQKVSSLKLDPVNELGLFPSNTFSKCIITASALPANIPFLDGQPIMGKFRPWFITGVAIFCLVEGLLIAGFLRQRAKKGGFERSFVEQMAFQRMLVDLSGTFVSLPEDETGPAIENSLSRIAELLNLDRISLLEYSGMNGELKVLFSWCNGKAPSASGGVKAGRFFWWTELLLHGEPVFISDLETLPEQAASEREYLRSLGAVSSATFPLRAGDKFLGSICFASTKRREFRTADLDDRLGLVAAIFSNALARKRAQQAHRECEERFRLAADAAPVLMWMSGPDKRCTFFNQGWQSFTGRSMEQELGDGWVSGVHPDDLESCVALYSVSFDARAAFEMEYRLRRFDGSYRWIVDFGVPRFESDGTFCGYVGSCVDITERKLSEESLRMLAGRLLRAQEEERARIARDLHDDFSQRLALLGISLGQLWKELPESEGKGRAKVLEMLQKTKELSSDIHSLSHQLHSSKLIHVGLGPALRGLCKEISEKYNIDIRFTSCEIPTDIPKDVALCLFRVAQEALGNIVKHSNTKDAQVELSANADGVNLCISDAGKGFDLGLQNFEAGIGLAGMSERLRLVGGRLSVRSEPDRGTDIFAEVPLAVSAKEQYFRTQAAGN
jgi:PAS domain S-box-containing protein